MIRRAATRITDSAPGFVTAGLVKTDSDENQTYTLVFEASGPGTLTEEPIANIKFMDGSPAEVPTL
jgi:hypothetical protein